MISILLYIHISFFLQTSQKINWQSFHKNAQIIIHWNGWCYTTISSGPSRIPSFTCNPCNFWIWVGIVWVTCHPPYVNCHYRGWLSTTTNLSAYPRKSAKWALSCNWMPLATKSHICPCRLATSRRSKPSTSGETTCKKSL